MGNTASHTLSIYSAEEHKIMLIWDVIYWNNFRNLFSYCVNGQDCFLTCLPALDELNLANCAAKLFHEKHLSLYSAKYNRTGILYLDLRGFLNMGPSPLCVTQVGFSVYPVFLTTHNYVVLLTIGEQSISEWLLCHWRSYASFSITCLRQYWNLSTKLCLILGLI